MSPNQVVYASLDDPIGVLIEKGKGRFTDPEAAMSLFESASYFLLFP